MKENQKNKIKNQVTKRRKSLKEKGITLIALVVTIIILLILAGVTLNIALSDNGLFNRTQNATDRYKKAQKDEEGMIAELDKTMEEIEGGKVADRTGLEIGDVVNYTYDEAENYSLEGKYSGYGEYEESEDGTYKLTKETDQSIGQVKNATWQVLNINDDGSVDLVCTSIAKNAMNYLSQFASGSDITEANAYGAVRFEGAIGYTNGVYYLNDICAKQYSNESLEVIARNIKIEDIEKHLNDVGKAAKQQYIEEAGTGEYTGKNAYYPKLYAYENDSGVNTKTLKADSIGHSDDRASGIPIPICHDDVEEGYENASERLSVQSTGYELSINHEENESIVKFV